MLAYFTFHGGLNDFLPRRQRHTTIAHPFDWKASIKDMLESLGPPHPEVLALVVNGAAVTFEYIVQPDDRIEVYDSAAQVPAGRLLPLIPPYPGRPRFILDTHLGRLAAYLRMMGFDTLYRNDYDDEELARVSDVEQRILLTRDIGLLKRSRVTWGYFVRHTTSLLSLQEIVQRYALAPLAAPFAFCMKCNGTLSSVARADIAHRLKPETLATFDTFHRCQSCGQIYWKGSHYEKMAQMIRQVLEPPAQG
ncbi:MAG: Mut7-C ubiquitin/RNAse domain-containing protein [Anaerolineae bacterium]|nr:Mut7-C ubiquitin/RNAse domain-containing protein [Anaerolineae bacterium]